MVEEGGDITILLRQWQEGSQEAEDQLFTLVLPHLRHLARYLMKSERQGHTLQATDLVDEACLRLFATQKIDWRNRQHFFAIAARVMRRYLIDYARGRPVAEFLPLAELDGVLRAHSPEAEQAIILDELLVQLADVNPDFCRVVELKFFLGLTDEETADAMGIPLRTMQRMWSEARQWLFKRMGSGDAHKSAGR